MHHLQEVEGMSLKACEYLVFDEADRLFEMGFADQLREVSRCNCWSRMGANEQHKLLLTPLLFSGACRPSPSSLNAAVAFAAPAQLNADPGGGGPLPPDPAGLGQAAFTSLKRALLFCNCYLQILAAVGPSRQTLLFSATMPAALAEFARAGLKVGSCQGGGVAAAAVLNCCASRNVDARHTSKSSLSLTQDPELVRLDTDTKISPDLSLAFFTVR